MQKPLITLEGLRARCRELGTDDIGGFYMEQAMLHIDQLGAENFSLKRKVAKFEKALKEVKEGEK